MTQTKIVMAALKLGAIAGAAIKPIDGEVKPANQKSTVVFKTTPEGDLKIHLYFPKDWKPGDRRPGILFFFGGGFTGGAPGRFTNMAEILRQPEYSPAAGWWPPRRSIASATRTIPAEKSIEDAKSAVRWLRINTRGLGVDLRRPPRLQHYLRGRIRYYRCSRNLQVDAYSNCSSPTILMARAPLAHLGTPGDPRQSAVSCNVPTWLR
jgi:hypothetical protein